MISSPQTLKVHKLILHLLSKSMSYVAVSFPHPKQIQFAHPIYKRKGTESPFIRMQQGLQEQKFLQAGKQVQHHQH
jgi:hypothetical protein